MLAPLTLLACSGAGRSLPPTPEAPVAEETAEAPEQAPAEESESPMLPTLNTTVPEALRCAVVVELVLEDSRYRGHPETPAHRAWVNGLSPEQYEMYTAESHGESYRECSYRVSVLGAPYRYTETWSTTWGELPEGWCEQAREHVAAGIQRTTLGCTELDRGAYYGNALTPL